MIENIVNDIPKFEFDNDVITISGKSIPFDAAQVWGIFVKQLELYLEERTKIEINFKLDIFNSSSSLYLTRIFEILNVKRMKIGIIVNWHYFAADESMEELGEIYKERNNYLEFNLKKRPK
jgi:hypothetical protein